MELDLEAELWRVVRVTLWVCALMSYVRFVSFRIRPGLLRLLALFPVLCLLLWIPWNFASIHLRGNSAFFLAWLAIFKLLLLSFGAGPLASPLPLLPFIASAALPVKLRSPATTSPSAFHSPLRYTAKAALLASLIPLYRFKHSLHPYLFLLICCLHIYLFLDLVLFAARSAAANLLPGLEIEPQFQNPFVAASLADFWGRRWNLMVSAALRPAVYLPVRARFGAAAGVLAAFLVSGLMHEVMFFYIARAPPTGEMTAFFAIHGACVLAEKMAQRAGWWRPPRAVAAPLTIGLVAATAFWFFFPPYLRHKIDEQTVAECMAAVNFLNRAVSGLLYQVRIL